MSNDGKLGLLAGVAVVLLVAVVAHRKGLNTAPDTPSPAKAVVGLPPAPVSVVPGANPTANSDPLLRGPVE